MAKRSTRNKIRFQATSAYEDSQTILELMKKFQLHIKGIDELADGQSRYIEANLPRIIVAFEMFVIGWQQFTDDL